MIKPHILQSKEWQKFEEALGRPTIDKKEKTWQYMAYLENGRFSLRLYCPYGPTVADKQALKEAVLDLLTEAKKLGADFIRIEPIGDITKGDLKNLGLKRRTSHYGVQPVRTVINDVSGSPETISAAVSQKVRRYARKAEKAGLTYSVSHNPDDIEYFLPMIHDVAKRTGMKPMSDDYFREIASTLFPTGAAGLLFAEYKGEKIASIIYYKNDDTMYYAHAANLSEYRDLSPANGLGLFALLFAHEQGCKNFDWYGIASEHSDTGKSLAGITQFKLSFGGQVKDYLGTWELPINKPKYLLYRILLRLTGKS